MALTFDIDDGLGVALLTDFFDGGPKQAPSASLYEWYGTDPDYIVSLTGSFQDFGSPPESAPGTGSIATLIEFSIGGTVVATASAAVDIALLFPAWQASGTGGVVDFLFDTGTSFALGPDATGTPLHTYHAGNRLVGNGNANILYADHDDATLEGGAGDDTLIGGGGISVLDAGEGDDVVIAGSGDATIHGGAGRDVLSYERLVFPATIDTSGVGAPFAGTQHFDGFEVLRGSLGGDTFDFDIAQTMPAGLVLQGLAGRDAFFDGAGMETIDYSADDAFGGSLGVVVNLTNDTLTKSTALPDAGSEAAVALALLLGTSEVAGRTIRDGFGDPDGIYAVFIINGSAHADFMLGSSDADTLKGDGGDDWLLGEDGSDSLEGGAGNDHLFGGADADVLRGGAADDVLEGGSQGDVLDGGDGKDTASYAHANAAVTAGLASPSDNTGDAAGDSYTGIENLTGSSFNDVLTGDDGANVIDGGFGNDVMKGRNGDDTYVVNSTSDVVDESASGGGSDTVRSSVNFSLADSKHAKGSIENLSLMGGGALKGTGNGGANALAGNSGANVLAGGGGNDTLNGGAGKDVLTGGAGRDAFVFSNKPASSTVDTIKDFVHHSDRIWLDHAAIQGIGTPGALAKAAFYSHSGAKHGHDANDRIVYDTHSGKLFYDDDGSGRHAAVQIALMSGHPKLDAADFLIV